MSEAQWRGGGELDHKDRWKLVPEDAPMFWSVTCDYLAQVTPAANFLQTEGEAGKVIQ